MTAGVERGVLPFAIRERGRLLHDPHAAGMERFDVIGLRAAVVCASLAEATTHGAPERTAWQAWPAAAATTVLLS